jgi:hypothetical protein
MFNICKLIPLLFLFTFTHAVQKELGELFNDLLTKDDFKGQKIIAIMPFKVGEGIPADAGRTVSEFAVVNLHSSGKYKIVERQEFGKMLAEQELAQSDLVDEDNQLKLGKMLVAERILVGSVTESFGKRMINARILDVSTGEVVATASTTLGPAAMDNFMKELLGERGQISSTVFRSMLPGWGQFYTGHPFQGSIATAAFVAALGFTGYSWLQYLSDRDALAARNVYKGTPEYTGKGEITGELNECYDDPEGFGAGDTPCPEHILQIIPHTKNMDDSYNQYLIGLGITGGVWLLNLVDAAIVGAQGKKKFDLYFSAGPKKTYDIRLSYNF